jgi:hypothetical protein
MRIWPMSAAVTTLVFGVPAFAHSNEAKIPSAFYREWCNGTYSSETHDTNYTLPRLDRRQWLSTTQ